MSHRPTIIATVSLAALALGGLACGSGDSGPPNPVAPAPSDATTTTTTGGSSGVGGAGGSAPRPTPRRTMERRNPLEGMLNDHMVDGGFELSVSFEGTGPQLGWFAFAGNQQAYVRMETGGLCRSGLRCGLLPPGTVLFGRGTSAGPETPIDASVAVKPPPGSDCSFVGATALPCDFSGNQVELELTAPEPADDGWCELRATIEPREEAMCLYIEANEFFEGEFLVDDARFLPAPAATEMRRFEPMPAARADQLRRIHRWIRDRTPIGRAASPPAAGAERRPSAPPPVGVK